MTSPLEPTQFADQIEQEIRYVRRYARALTGAQASGDAYALATLEMAATHPDVMDGDVPLRIALFREFHKIWRKEQPGLLGVAAEGLEGKAQSHLARLTLDSREALLLRSLEGFGVDDIAQIMSRSPEQVKALIDTAHKEMLDSVAGRILIIEDEVIIALDLQSLATEMGHKVTGIARTEVDAVAMAQKDRPDLILADIQLADKSSGIDAVHQMLADQGQIPVIFITAYPERLLTGRRPEPAFLITKPYSEDQVRSAIGQAMFFASTEVLQGHPGD